jgi:hypothetical protein
MPGVYGIQIIREWSANLPEGRITVALNEFGILSCSCLVWGIGRGTSCGHTRAFASEAQRVYAEYKSARPQGLAEEPLIVDRFGRIKGKLKATRRERPREPQPKEETQTEEPVEFKRILDI